MLHVVHILCLLLFLGHFEGGTEQRKKQFIEVITQICKNTVKIRNSTKIINIFNQTLNILTSYFTFIFTASPAAECKKKQEIKRNVINSKWQ